MDNEQNAGTCFVVMGFGKKTDFETGRTLDLDKSYRNMIKPAVEAAGLKCIRADEIVHSGLIDVPMYEQLLNADVVVADLSTSNKNAFYELGIRHALRPFTTVVICEDGVQSFPFDVNHVAVRKYHHLGEDIGFDDVMKFRELLTSSIKEIFTKDPREKDSPVYTFLNNLTPPAYAVLTQAIKNLDTVNAVAGASEPADTAANQQNQMTHSLLMQMVDDAVKGSRWDEAKTMMKKAIEMQKDTKNKDVYTLQRLALITYKSKTPSEKEALENARDILKELNPGTSNDTETLGMWGAIHKRLYELNTADKTLLDEAIRAYERGFYLRNDYYNGINYAFLLNVRSAANSNKGEAIADFVQARRIREEVKTICEGLIAEQPKPETDEQVVAYWKTRYWIQATLGEALLGLGETEKANTMLEEAYSNAPESWMLTSTKPQMEKLAALLNQSPLQYIQAP